MPYSVKYFFVMVNDFLYVLLYVLIDFFITLYMVDWKVPTKY